MHISSSWWEEFIYYWFIGRLLTERLPKQLISGDSNMPERIPEKVFLPVHSLERECFLNGHDRQQFRWVIVIILTVCPPEKYHSLLRECCSVVLLELTSFVPRNRVS